VRTRCHDSRDRGLRRCEEVGRVDTVREGKCKANEGSIRDRRQGEVQGVRCERCTPMGLDRDMDNESWYESADTVLTVLVRHSIREKSGGRRRGQGEPTTAWQCASLHA
jgi:hypothetical protein